MVAQKLSAECWYGVALTHVSVIVSEIKAKGAGSTQSEQREMA